MSPLDLPSSTGGSSSLSSFYSNTPISGGSKQDPKAIGGMFEAIFYRMLFRQARESKMDDEDFLGGKEMDTILEWRDNEIAQQLGSMGELGLVDLVAQEASKEGDNWAQHTSGLLKSPTSKGA